MLRLSAQRGLGRVVRAKGNLPHPSNLNLHHQQYAPKCNRSLSSTFSSSETTTATKKSSSSFRQTIRDLWSSGSILMGLGGLGLALLVVDRTLQYYDRQDATQLMRQVKDDQATTQRQLYNDYHDKPTLRECVVKVVYKMGGTHGLPNISQDQVVEVVQEGVGPQGSYAMCRTRNEQGEVVAVGWYPMSFLEPKKTKSWWQWR